HIQGGAELTVRVSQQSGCRGLLSSGQWSVPVRGDLTVGFITALDSQLDLTLTADPKGQARFHSATDELEALELEPLRPMVLLVRPHGLTRVDQTLRRAGEPLMTISNLRLGGDHLEVDITGLVGLPIGQMLGFWKWPVFIGIDLVLVVWIV